MSLLTDLGEYNKERRSGPIFRISLAGSLSVEGPIQICPGRRQVEGKRQVLFQRNQFASVPALGPMVQLQGLRCQHLDLICNEQRGGSFHFPG